MIDLNDKALAINGGEPIRTKSWVDNFSTGEEEKLAVMRVMDSKYLSLFEGSHHPDAPFSFYGGPEVQSLEEMWAEYYNCQSAISMNSATSCLYAAIGALEIGFGDEVIVSPYTMSACAMAPMIYGAIPVFADVEMDSGSLDPKSIAKKITPRTKAILVVHQFGIPADMDAIMKIAKEHNLRVIEDCAQAHGAMYKGQYVGTIGDIGVFSLNVNKSIQCGEGGVCVTNDKDLAYRLALIRNHGEAVVGPAQYSNITNIAGFNYRLTEIQAAIAKVQLGKLDELNDKRLKLVEQFHEGIEDIEYLTPLKNREGCKSTYYVLPLRFDESKAGVPRNEFVTAVNAEGALFYQGYSQPLYWQPVYQNKSLFKNNYPFSAKENQDCIKDYSHGLCPNSELLHIKQMIINEHVRYPHNQEDIQELIDALYKIGVANIIATN